VKTRFKSALVSGIVAATAFGGLGLAATAASAAPSVTASTHITNNLDSGGNGNWSADNFGRTLTVTPGAAAGTYTATIHDSGHWSGIVGSFTPNQGGANAGTKINHSVSGVFSGEASYSFTASTAPSAANVAHALNDNFTAQSGKNTTSLWYEQAFSAGTVFGGTGIQNTWSWTYNETSPACHQHWTDAFVSGDGQLSADGNITGAPCVVPIPPSHLTIQAQGHVQSEWSHKYLTVSDGKLVQEPLGSSSRFAMVENSGGATGLEVENGAGHLTGEFVTIPNSGQATVVNHFVVTSKHGSFYYNTQDTSGHVLNDSGFSDNDGGHQIGWVKGAFLNEQYTSPGM
jgi:hypothetical protein